MTNDPMREIRDQLVTGVAGEPRRVRQRRRIIGAGLVVLLIGVGVVLTSVSGARGGGEDLVVANRTDTTSSRSSAAPSATEPDPVWSIEQPPGWSRGGHEIMPNLGWDSLTLATVELRPGGQRCAHVPEQALRDLGSGDALVSIFFVGSEDVDADPWPSAVGFGDLEPQSEGDAFECAERNDLEIYWEAFARSGQSFYVLVAFGSGVSEERRTQTWDTLSSFRPVHPDAGGSTPVCVVTVPPAEPSTLPTTGTEEFPAQGQGWYGTLALWTVLSNDGTHQPQRKSVWWSGAFPGGADEENPPIRVTWTQLNEEDPNQVVADSGRNAFTDESGWFMIADAEEPTDPGCWEVTAQYKGAELSYVYWNSATTG